MDEEHCVHYTLYLIACTVADEEWPVKPMPILWYQEMFAESRGPFCGHIIYQKCARRIGKQKEAKCEK